MALPQSRTKYKTSDDTFTLHITATIIYFIPVHLQYNIVQTKIQMRIKNKVTSVLRISDGSSATMCLAYALFIPRL